MLKESIDILMRGEHLNAFTCRQVFEEMLNPDVNALQVAAFLVLLRTKKETINELLAILKVMQEKMLLVHTQHSVLDIVGTGGDGFNTINISTGSALLAASCGIKIAKHGNRAFSSLTGSADVMEALGINIDLTPEQIAKSIDEIGIGFCYTPNFHPVTQTLRQLRKKLNVPTIFNLLGPLLNPAQPKYLLLGVADKSLLTTFPTVLLQMNINRALVIHGGGLDEISSACLTTGIEVSEGKKKHIVIDPQTMGFKPCSIADLRGGDAATNADLLLQCFKGKPSPIADTLILNAATALYLYGRYASIHEALSYSRDVLESGAVLRLLNKWVEFSHDQT